MKISEIKGLDTKELTERMENEVQKIARMKTELRQRELNK